MRLPQVGDWIKNKSWSRFYQIASVEGDYIRVYTGVSPNGTCQYERDKPWIFRDPVEKVKSGFARFVESRYGT